MASSVRVSPARVTVGGWQDDPNWTSWWGANPPFHTPTFVLTHRPRSSIAMEGGTTFHFLDATPEAALKTAGEAAGSLDVRIGGGPTMVRDFRPEHASGQSVRFPPLVV